MLTEEQVKKANEAAMAREVMDLRVLVVGGGFQYIKMFFDAGFKGATSVADADIICFTGGADVDPALYGEKALAETFFNTARDEVEQQVYIDAVASKKPMVGICRGSQFLTVMNGGRLWQDVNNHARTGGHSVVDLRDGTVRHNMTSTHHQMMRPADDAEVLAVATLATVKKSASEEIRLEQPEENADVEACWYQSTRSLCFQPHPEFSFGECRDFFLDLVDSYVIPAC